MVAVQSVQAVKRSNAIFTHCETLRCVFIMHFWFVYLGLQSTTLSLGSLLLSCLRNRSCIICFSERYICFMNPCHNGGICVENPLAPCLCPNGYVGKYCIGKNFFLLQWSYTISYISKEKNMLIWNTSFLPKITCVDQIHACTKALAK